MDITGWSVILGTLLVGIGLALLMRAQSGESRGTPAKQSTDGTVRPPTAPVQPSQAIDTMSARSVSGTHDTITARSVSGGIDRVRGDSGTHYTLLRLLGEGAMGMVYEGVDAHGIRVAVKVLGGGTWSDPELRERFQREVEVCRRVQHPNVIKVLDWGLWNSSDGRWSEMPFMVMELVQGQALNTRLHSNGGILPVKEAIDWLQQSLQGLAAAHAMGVVHRDIKPDNLMRTKNGVVKVLDFGIAHLLDASLTGTGRTMGTPTYMSPEHLDARHVVPASDVYSLGTVTFEMLCGHAPFSDVADLFSLALKIMNEAVPPVAQVNQDVPADVAAIVDRMLARSLGARYDTAQAALDDLTPLAIRLKA